MTSGPFQPLRIGDVADLIDRHPLAWVVSAFPDFRATPLPLLADCDQTGRVTALIGHFAAANAQVEQLRAHPRALFLFNGPQAYVSPGLLTTSDWAPTWNYAAVRIVARVELDEALNDLALKRLVARMERESSDPWDVGALGERYETMKRHIIAFRATILLIEPGFKLGQDERSDVFEEIVARHPDSALVQWMRRSRPGTG
jgi:transcriptional regulator